MTGYRRTTAITPATSGATVPHPPCTSGAQDRKASTLLTSAVLAAYELLPELEHRSPERAPLGLSADYSQAVNSSASATQPPQNAPTASRDELDFRLRQWINGLHIEHIAHSRAAAALHRRHWGLGVTATIVAAGVGTSAFAGLQDTPRGWALWLVSAASIGTAALTALVAFMDYSARSARHTASALQFGSLRRRAELLSASAKPHSELLVAMSEINKSWEQVAESSPQYPPRLHEWARAKVPRAQRT
ncbi:SLATT domain-containing protein [Cellulomonas hominis]|uniref:SLATT domain-containing protein n=1 Tax=Cellulomonas hominis TaxID=156981 RepID=A0A7Z8NR41_9CELL|nr:SLATT domain-containing protein [Cellulomonas hominis]